MGDRDLEVLLAERLCEALERIADALEGEGMHTLWRAISTFEADAGGMRDHLCDRAEQEKADSGGEEAAGQGAQGTQEGD